MTTVSKLYDIPLFQGLPEGEVQWLIGASVEEFLETGDAFYQEGEYNPRFYIVLDGELQVTRTFANRRVVLGTTPRGIMGGEMSIMQGIPSQVTSRAIMPTHLMVLELDAFRQMFAHAPEFGTRVMKVAGERMAGTATISVQQEKMAALGKLSAGLAHELNNPASAVRRAASSLQETVHNLQLRTLQLVKLGMTNEQLYSLITMQKEVIRKVPECPIMSPLDLADREDAIGDYLDELEVENSWEIAPVLANAALRLKDVQNFVSNLPPHAVSDILNWACVGLTAATLLDEMTSGSERISELVGAVKSYTYMDRAPTQEVDINHSLQTTLKVMHYKLRGIEIIRQFADDLPLITGRGSELNQVFTNIIDNAADALEGNGQLTVTTRDEAPFIMIEITDNGPGIPPDVMPHIFEPFFTTKDVGKGTGMGLELSYRIIQEHGGTIETHSEPGQTRFIVRLPIQNSIESD
jgi:signal transduction histidine kinase